MITEVTQRWRSRRDSYRPAREPIDVTQYGVEPIDRVSARAFVVAHHYSASFPAERFSVGLFRCRAFARAELVGAAVFSTPMNAATIARHIGLADQRAGAELGRFVLLDEVEANGESYFLARAFDALRAAKPEICGVVSYSDPLPRLTDDGQTVKPGHIGNVYQATNANYRGLSKAETLFRTRDWRILSRRTLSKLRNDERGAANAYRMLRDLGAPARQLGEDGAAYVERALRDGPFVRLRHPGNHVYVFGLDRRLRRGLPASLPYPKMGDLRRAA